MEIENNQTKNIFEDGEVCRLCLRPITGEGKSQQVPVDSVEMFKLKVNGSVATDLGISCECLDSVPVHCNFIKNEKEEIEEVIPVAMPYHEIKKEEDEEGKTLLHFPNDLTGYSVDNKSDMNNVKTNCQYSVESRESKQYNSSETRMYACYNTGCKCKHRQFIHTDTAEVQIYKCDECQFETECSYSMKSHQLTHKEVLMYCCDKCSYKSYNRDHLKHHQLTHKKPWEMQMYKCDLCPVETKLKSSLKVHQLKHKDPSEVQIYKMYSCDNCSYETYNKHNLKLHQLTHKKPWEVQMYKCDRCPFETKHKFNLTKHMLIHKDPSEVQMHKCNKCKYETKHKCSLKAHMLLHRDPSEVPMYKCDHCNLEFKTKAYLKKHQKTHKNPSEVQMYKCNKCSFETKRKDTLKVHKSRHKSRSTIPTVPEKDKIQEQKMGEIFVVETCIKTEEIEIKHEELNEEVIPVAISYHEIKKEDEGR